MSEENETPPARSDEDPESPERAEGAESAGPREAETDRAGRAGRAPSPAAPEAEAEGFDLADAPGGVRGALEAVLMVVEEPVEEAALAGVLELDAGEVHDVLVGLAAEYEREQRGFDLRFTAGGWRMYSRPAFSPVVERFLVDGRRARLSVAALETLAVIAYRQPVSRARVGAVRGVNVDGVVRTLLTRGLITETGVDEEHGAVLYGTTPYFLERLGLGSLDDLPPLAPYLPEVDMLDDIAAEGRP